MTSNKTISDKNFSNVKKKFSNSNSEIYQNEHLSIFSVFSKKYLGTQKSNNFMT